MGYDRRDRDERQLRALKQEIAERLHGACERLPAEEFEQLVDRIARIQHKYEVRGLNELLSSARDLDAGDSTKANDVTDHGHSP